MSPRNLINEQYDVLSYGLDHGLATSLSCNDVLPSKESVWDHLTGNNLLKENYHFINRTKNCLRAIAYNLIDLDNQKVFQDKKLQIIKDLRKDTVIVKLDKGNGVLAIDTRDYYEYLNRLFSDPTKFKRPYADSTNTKLSILQCYLRKSYNRDEISEEVFEEILPKNGKVVRPHRLPKVYQSFEWLSSFWLTVDTIGSTQVNIGKYITKLPYHTTQTITERNFWCSWKHQKDTQRTNQKWRLHTDIVRCSFIVY